MRRLTVGIHLEKCVVRQFLHCKNIIEHNCRNLDEVACYTLRLYKIYNLLALGHKSVQHITVLNTVGNYTIVFVNQNIKKVQ